MSLLNYDVVVIGGGAAGFFSAINIAEKNKNLRVCILERGREVLQKVRISGGGRCNVTHACFEAETLSKFYPRGQAELIEPFKQFSPLHTIEWFEKHGVKLKTEADGRMFPITDSSHTIIDCFYDAARKNKINVQTNSRVEAIDYQEDTWRIFVQNQTIISTKKLILATGSDTAIWKLLSQLSIAIIPPVPSLFTFNIKDKRFDDLMGLSVQNVLCEIVGADIQAKGAILVTHWGISGPAILRLSAWGARYLAEKNYCFKLKINYLPQYQPKELERLLHELLQTQSKKNVMAHAEFGIPTRLWKKICQAAEIREFQKWAETGKKHIAKLVEQLSAATFEVTGKSTNKDEFVTAGGINLNELDFDTFSLKKYPSLFVAGEVLNIDAITGGFNFQAAWTGGWIISESFK